MRTIAFLGDSITFGYGLADSNKRYSTLLSESLGLEEQNYGIAGTLVARTALNATDGRSFVDRVGLIDGADVAVIFGGTNDYFWSDKPISGEENDAYFDHAVETLCKHIVANREGKVTLFVTPYPHNGVGNYLNGEKWRTSHRHDTDSVNFNGHTLRDYCRVIADTCRRYGIECLDLHDGFDFFGFDWWLHTIDGCHPNEEGHRLLAEAIEKRLRTMLGESV